MQNKKGEVVMKFQDAINEFILDRESLGRKPKTLRFYRTNLKGLTTFLESQDVVTVGELGRGDMRAFFAVLNRCGLSDDTLAAYDRSVRTFFKFCMAEGWLEEDPMADRPRLKQAESLPDTLSMEEMDRLLATCDDSPLGRRDLAIMLLMLDTGMRAGEVVRLTMNRLTLNSERGKITIPARKAKGKKDRTVLIWTDTVEALKVWLEVRPVGAETVFVASDGYRLTTRPLEVDGLGALVRRRAKRAGVSGKQRWCHIWRHTFAKRYVLGGGDLETLRRLLGHRNLETVKIYLKFKVSELEKRHWELSPVRQLSEWREDGRIRAKSQERRSWLFTGLASGRSWLKSVVLG